MIRLYDSTVHRWETHQLSPPPASATFSFSPLRQAGGMKRKLHIIHRETSLQRPFPMKRDRGMNAKSVETNVGWIAFNDNTSLLFQFRSSSSVSFRDERNTAERNLIEENKSESRAQNSFCPRFLPASPESNPPRDYYFRVNNLSTKSETRLLTTFTLSKPNFLENVAAVSLPPTNSTQGANHHLCYHLLQICKPVQAKIYRGSPISFVSNETLLLFIQTHRNGSIELLNNCSKNQQSFNPLILLSISAYSSAFNLFRPLVFPFFSELKEKNSLPDSFEKDSFRAERREVYKGSGSRREISSSSSFLAATRKRGLI